MGQIFKTRLFIEGHDLDSETLVDTVFYKDAWWLVPEWLKSDATGELSPLRLIRLSGLRYEEGDDPECRFFLNTPIPKSVLDGEKQSGYEVVSLLELAAYQKRVLGRHE